MKPSPAASKLAAQGRKVGATRKSRLLHDELLRDVPYHKSLLKAGATAIYSKGSAIGRYIKESKHIHATTVTQRLHLQCARTHVFGPSCSCLFQNNRCQTEQAPPRQLHRLNNASTIESTKRKIALLWRAANGVPVFQRDISELQANPDTRNINSQLSCGALRRSRFHRDAEIIRFPFLAAKVIKYALAGTW